MWKLNNILLNNQWIKEEIKGEIRRLPEINENKNTTYQNKWNVAKAVLRVKFKTINTYIKKKKRSQANHLILHLKQLEKEKQTKPKFSRKEITKIRVKVNERE